jgi:predicted nuclease with RNAse H fold
MKFLLGFDPGGERKFGWAVVRHSKSLPLQVCDTGIVDHAEAAVSVAFDYVKDTKQVVAVGIDAPMFWTPSCQRRVDCIVRHAIQERRDSGRTVLRINSLRGACVVQGIVTGLLLRGKLPRLPISESHPKALLRIIGQHGIRNYIALPNEIRDEEREDERDAALSAVSSWAMITHARNWTDLLSRNAKRFI